MTWLSRLAAAMRRTASIGLASAALATLEAPPTAAHPIDDVFFSPGDTSQTLETPFEPAEDCLGCHAEVDAPATTAPGDGWLGSMKANSFRDPLFRAALSIANQDFLDSGTFCLRCHAPVGWLADDAWPPDGSEMSADARNGATCAFCHRLDDGDDREVPGPLSGTGGFYLHDEAVYRAQRRDPHAPHGAGHSKHLESSWACAGCHSLSNPVRPLSDPEDPERELAPRFPALRTFEEWRDSAFPDERVECQDCHMAAVEGRSASDAEAPIRADLATHDFAGGNAWGPVLLDAAFPGERPEAYGRAYGAAIASLQRAATLRIDLPAAFDADRPTAFSVRVENLTGHKLPTGYPDLRRVWLEVTARVGAEAPWFASGTWDADRDAPAAGDQLRTYEARAGIAGAGPSFHFVLNDALLSDTRIPPRGFRATLTTRPIGRDYGDGEDALRHWDDAPFTVPAPPVRAGTVTVTARLMYQAVSRELVEFLRDENVIDESGRRLHALWAATGRAAPVEMARVEAQALIAERDGGPADGSAGDAATRDAGGDPGDAQAPRIDGATRSDAAADRDSVPPDATSGPDRRPTDARVTQGDGPFDAAAVGPDADSLADAAGPAREASISQGDALAADARPGLADATRADAAPPSASDGAQDATGSDAVAASSSRAADSGCACSTTAASPPLSLLALLVPLALTRPLRRAGPEEDAGHDLSASCRSPSPAPGAGVQQGPDSRRWRVSGSHSTRRPATQRGEAPSGSHGTSATGRQSPAPSTSTQTCPAPQSSLWG